MFGKIDEHDEGECEGVVGLAMGRCADEVDKCSAPQPGFLKNGAGRNRPVRLGAGGGEGGCRFLSALRCTRASSLSLGGA